MFTVLISNEKGKVEEMSHLYVRQSRVAPGKCVDVAGACEASWEEAAVGNEGLEAHAASGSILACLLHRS